MATHSVPEHPKRPQKQDNGRSHQVVLRAAYWCFDRRNGLDIRYLFLRLFPLCKSLFLIKDGTTDRNIARSLAYVFQFLSIFMFGSQLHKRIECLRLLQFA